MKRTADWAAMESTILRVGRMGDEFVVIEVNDNPTINRGEEDQKAPQIYERLVRYLVRDWGE